MRLAKGQPSCPASTHPVGLMCLTVLDVEDAEDIFIFGLLIAGFLLIGAGGFLMYRQICKLWNVWAVVGRTQTDKFGDLERMLAVVVEQGRKVQDAGWTRGLPESILDQNRKLTAVLDLTGRIGVILEKLQSRLGVEK